MTKTADATTQHQALAPPEPPVSKPVYLVATGKVYEHLETYTRHDVCPPMCDAETLYTTPKGAQPAPAEPYQFPDGWQLVPIEASDDMLNAGKREAHGSNGARDKAKRIYRAMLAAAPKAA